MRSRRNYLKGSGVALAFVLAGCSDSDSAGEESPADEETEQEEAPDEEPEPEDEPEAEEETDLDDHEEIDRAELEELTRTAVDEALGDADDAPEEAPETEETETDDTEEDGDTVGETTEPDETDDGTNDEDGTEEEDETTDGETGDADGEGSEPADESEQETDEGTTETDDTAESEEEEPSLSGTVFAQIDYEGEWMFAYSTPNRTSSFDRADRQTIEIEDDLDVVSVAVQKADDSNEELTALVLIDGQIVADAATTDAFGIAHATHSVY